MNYTDITTFEKACEVKGIETALPDYSAIPEVLQKPMTALYQLIIITSAINGDEVVDWSNGKWDKWFPWFDMDDSSSPGRFSFNRSDNRDSHSYCGSRLCFISEEKSDFAGKHFEDLYREWMVMLEK
jgi:hypothetical protein